MHGNITLQQATLRSWITGGRSQQQSNNLNDSHDHNNYNINPTNDTNNNDFNNIIHIDNNVYNNDSRHNNINDTNLLVENALIQRQNYSTSLPATRGVAHINALGTTRLRQQTLGSNLTPLTADNRTHWGNIMSTKERGIFRIGFRNINSLPVQRSHPKNLKLIEDIKEANVDCMGIAEVNLAWQHLPYTDQLHERFRGTCEFAKFVSANNRDPKYSERKQSGGTMTIVNGNMSARIIGIANDPRQMGRWCSILFRGKNGLKFRVITIYRPVHSLGSLSAYQQQRYTLLDSDIDVCPRTQILNDLRDFISKCKNDGEQLIVVGDFNEDVRGRSLTSFFSDLDLREVLLERHGNEAPNTYRDGTNPIDGIFGTRNIHIVAGGYLGFDWGLSSDHRMLWIDLRADSILGTEEIPLWKPMARRLKCNDPRLVDRFNLLRFKHANRNQLFQKINRATTSLNNNQHIISSEIKTMLDEIDVIRTKGILWADRYCRKLKMGNVPWSPAIQQCMDRIKYYNTCRLRFEFGRHINSRTLKQLFNKTSLSSKAMNKEEARVGLKNTFNQYNLLKSQATQLRVSFLDDLAEAIAVQGNGTKEKILRQLQLHEEQRSVARKIKYTLGKQRVGVSSVEFLNQQGGWEVTVDKVKIEEECIMDNIRRFTQANNSPSLQPDQVALMGWTADTDNAMKILNGDNSINGLDPAIVRLAPFLRRPTFMSPISTDISRDDYNYYWTRCREFTSTGTSGLHFGHFIASTKDPSLGEIDRWLVELSFRTGYAPQRWHYGIDVMIPKKNR